MRREKLYKIRLSKFLLRDSNSFPKLNMKNPCGSALSPHDKNAWKIFLFIGRVFYINCVEFSTVYLSKKELRFYRFLKSKYLQNKNVFQEF